MSRGAATYIIAVMGMVTVTVAVAVGHRLEGHGVVKLKGVGSGHGGASADGVKETRGSPA